jgi:hypothetical protein
MSNTTFSNGQILVSSANTPDTLAAMLQPILTQILGVNADPDSAVRLAWPQTGQPAWGISEDVCFVRFTAENDDYSRVRDSVFDPNDVLSVRQSMSFTQVWNMHLVLYGPNCYDRARLILSAMDLDWVHDALADKNLYGIVNYPRPAYAPELRAGQWWKRADVTLQFNELVNESITTSTAAGVDVTILTDSGEAEEFVIGNA